MLTTALESVQARAKQKGLQNIQTLRADLERPQGSTLPDTSQDIVLAANILIQSKKVTEILSEAARILKPGGTCAVVEWKRGVKGFGPPDDMRIDAEDLQKKMSAEFSSVSDARDVGGYHVLIIATK